MSIRFFDFKYRLSGIITGIEDPIEFTLILKLETERKIQNLISAF
ncbi:hypothetical protein SBF1_2700005 [Candidatus Desulfosporosinus infrequens]|uniref:Uncharacterized protein n=1 Tax=Candidatus Desulfosporosinus infrequens TaxID=2043169 RepID=A0A2U3KTJ5_9FIRM|nr:hypothetical protein SBF1_2700005 [Candidatus Desulfosporosinus infrequens]